MREIAAKIGFTEGPAWTGERLLAMSISRGLVYEIALDGSGASEVASPEGGPNGCAVAADGSVWIAQNGGHVITQLPEPVVPPGIQRWSGGEEVDYVATTGLRAPNDLAFAPDGSLWFTDPHPRMDRDAPKPGTLWRLDTTDFSLTPQFVESPQPNGLAFSPGGDWLYMIETIPRRVLRFPVRDGGSGIGEPEELVTLEGEPDGMAIDVEGRLVIACHHTDDAVMVCEPDGSIVQRIDMSGLFPSNVCFAGPSLSTLVVTCPKGGRVVAIERDVPGLAIPPAPPA